MGDAETISESEILSKGYELASDVIKIGHHGSDSSTSNAFLSVVHPKYAVISVGADNSYGHPTPTTIEKLKDANVEYLRTDENGTITFESDSSSISTSFTKTIQTEKLATQTPSPTVEPTPVKSPQPTPEPTQKPIIKPTPEPTKDVVVYVTNTGEKYHTSSCRYLT